MSEQDTRKNGAAAPENNNTAASGDAPKKQTKKKARRRRRIGVPVTLTIVMLIISLLFGLVVGYAYGSRLFSRAAYAWSAELSVYFSTDHRGRGLGRAIYGKLFDLLALQGVRTVVGKVVCPNEKSDHLHEKMGFELVGALRAASWKLGAWHDVHLWEKHIGDVEAEPAPLLRLSEVDSEKVRAILEA